MTTSFILATGAYLLKVILVSGVLYVYYHWNLRNRLYHQFNRCFLLGIPLLSLALPFIHLPLPAFIWPARQNIPLLPDLHTVTDGDWKETDAAIATHMSSTLPSWQLLVTGAYLLVFVTLLYFFFRQLRYIQRLTKRYPEERLGNIRFFTTDEPGTPFSFLNRIFWNHHLDPDNAISRQIFRHELNHVRQLHSVDLLLLRILTALCWVNPFFHLIYREIRAVHEFLADNDAVSEGDKYQYAEALVWQTVKTPSVPLLHPFFQSPVKRRINMIIQGKNTRATFISRAMILPLLFLLLCAFGTKHRAHPPISASDKPLTIVIDAGHGGIDPGGINKDGVAEKNINLSIAEKIKSLSSEYNVRVLMTRETDELAGGKSSKRESLEYRAQMANDSKADAFISIHTEVDAPEHVKGFNIFVAEDNAHYPQCVQLGSALIETLKKSYPTETALKKRKEHIYVLGSTDMPAVLVQCGNINDEKDLAFIRNEDNQTKVARDILAGIRNYAAGRKTGQ
jgi:N-acetylmuramoyl-L-alanine amidase